IGESAAAQTFQYSAGDVGTRGVEHGVVVGERHLVEHRPVVVYVEGGPTAVFGLHGQQPVDGASLAGGLRLRVGSLGVHQREQHLRGVVDIGVKLVGEFECPARR